MLVNLGMMGMHEGYMYYPFVEYVELTFWNGLIMNIEPKRKYVTWGIVAVT